MSQSATLDTKKEKRKTGNNLRKERMKGMKGVDNCFLCSVVVRSGGRHTKIPLTCLCGCLSSDSKL